MIQIIALRTYVDKNQKTQVAHRVVSKKWQAPSVSHLFNNWESYRDSIPKKERWNIYYTAANCKPGDPSKHTTWRKFESQEIICFDIDGMDTNQEGLDNYIDILCNFLKIDRKKTGIVFSGNGLQLVIQLDKPFTRVDYFEEARLHYRSICAGIDKELKSKGLTGSADSSVWSLARILRFGGTTNDKTAKGKGITEAKFLQTNLEPQGFSLESASGIPEITESEQLNGTKDYPAADNRAILAGCDFLKDCQSNPDKISEPEWYAALSITARMENGVELSHQLSSGHPNYSHQETELKIEQAISSSGPRTCSSINAVWGKCKGCPHFNTRLLSPILIKSEDFIATEKTGFHVQIKNKEGKVTKTIPQFQDLLKYFDREGKHRIIDQSGICYRHTGTHYDLFSETQSKAFAQENFNPKPKNATRTEFASLVKATNLVPAEFFNNTNGLINFQNGVLNIHDNSFVEHSDNFGFRYVLPYNYDANATAPRFENFLKEVTGNDDSLIRILEEFGGYALSGDRCWIHKALVLTGDGSNGKSTFLATLQQVAGDDNYSAVDIKDLRHENNRQLLEGKLFNVSGETPDKALDNTSDIKGIIAGDRVHVKLMYNQPYFITNRCKILFSCNRLPASKDSSHGLLRRLILVPFDQDFSDDKGNDDKSLPEKLNQELPGIFNVFLKGYKRLLSQKQFTKSKRADDQLAEYQESIDSVVRFHNEFMEQGDETDEIPTSDLYQKYRMMCEENGFKSENDLVFKKKLSKIMPNYKANQSRMRLDGKQIRSMKNIICTWS